MNVTVTPARGGPASTSTIALLLVAAASLALWPALTTLAANWRDMVSYDHGPLIVLISAYWLWRARDGFAGERWVPSPSAACAFVVALLAWLVAFRALSNLGMQVLWPAILYLALATAGGWRVAAHARLAVAFLYFAIPIWDLLLPALQALTSFAAGNLLGVLGVPVLLEGNHVTIPAGAFVVVEDCAGKRFLVVALATATLLAAEYRLPARRFALALLAGAALAILSNWIRVIVVIVAGHLTDMQSYLVATEHKTFGYVVFAALLLSLFAVIRRIARPELAASRDAMADEPTVVAAAASAPPTRRWIVASVAVAAVLLATGLSTLRGADAAAVETCLAPLPDRVGGWTAGAVRDPAWQPSFQGAAIERRADYAGPDGPIGVYVNRYGVQQNGRELVSFANTDLGPGRWERLPAPPGAALGGSGDAPVVATAAGPGGARYLVATRYHVGGVLTGRSAMAQLAYGVQSVAGAVPAGVLLIVARCDLDCDAAATRLSRFWEAAGPALARQPGGGGAATDWACGAGESGR